MKISTLGESVTEYTCAFGEDFEWKYSPLEEFADKEMQITRYVKFVVL